MSTFSLKHRVTKTLAGFVLVFVLAGGLGVPTQQVHAQAFENVNVIGGIGTIKEFVTAAATAATSLDSKALTAKEFYWDAIAYNLAQIALQQVTKSTIQWINSGFEGNPAFVTDLEGFLLQSADEVIGEYIYGTELGFLCSPIKLDIQIALELAYDSSIPEVQCTLSDVVGNVDAFMAGDFLAGGLPGWFELTTNPNNNFFGALASAEYELDRRLQDQRLRDAYEYIVGDGFLPKKDCIIQGEGEECSVTMPGKAISEALTFELSTGRRALLEADEINELVGTLFIQLAQQALTSDGGLTGLSRTGGSYGSTSYLDRVGNPAFEPAPPQNSFASRDIIGEALDDERAYQQLYAGVANEADAILGRIAAESCTNIGSIESRAVAIRQDARAIENEVGSNVLILQDLASRFAIANQNSRYSQEAALEANAALDEFFTLRASGTLHSSITYAEDEFEVEQTRKELANLDQDLDSRCDEEEDRERERNR